MIATTIKSARRVKEKRDWINQWALKLIRKNGFDAMTMRELSEATRMAAGNLYAYIGSKDDVLFLVHKNAAELLAKTVEESTANNGTPREILRRMIEVEFDLKHAIHDAVIVMYREAHHLQKSHLQEILTREEIRLGELERVIRVGIAEGQFRNVSPEAVAHCIVASIDGWILRRWTIQKKLSAEDMKRHLVDMVFAQLDALPGETTHVKSGGNAARRVASAGTEPAVAPRGAARRSTKLNLT